jgi:hypothetical protein
MMVVADEARIFEEARLPHNLAAAPAEMMKSFVPLEVCRNQLAPFDVPVEPPDGFPTSL